MYLPSCGFESTPLHLHSTSLPVGESRSEWARKRNNTLAWNSGIIFKLADKICMFFLCVPFECEIRLLATARSFIYSPFYSRSLWHTLFWLLFFRTRRENFYMFFFLHLVFMNSQLRSVMMKLQYIVVSMAQKWWWLLLVPIWQRAHGIPTSAFFFYVLAPFRFGSACYLSFCCCAILRERNKIYISTIHMNVYGYRISGLCHEDAWIFKRYR